MDPLSIAASLTGLILFAKEVGQLANDLYQTVKRKPEVLRTIAQDLDSLQSVLGELKHVDELTQERRDTTEKAVLTNVLSGCSATLANIRDHLDTLQQMFSRKMVSRLLSYKKFDEETKVITGLRQDLEALKVTLSIALQVRQIKSATQSVSVSDITALLAELSQVKDHLQHWKSRRDSNHLNPIQQYIDVSAVIVNEAKISNSSQSIDGSAGQGLSASYPAGNLTMSNTISTQSHSSSDQDMENVRSFGSFDDWLTSFSPANTEGAGEQGQQKVEHIIHSPELGSSVTSCCLSRNSRIQITVQDLITLSYDQDQPLPTQETIELDATDFVYRGIQQLQDRGHKGICGFRLGEHLLGPLATKTGPVPVYVTDGPSSFEASWLEIKKEQPLENFYDELVRSKCPLEPIKMYKDATALTVLDEFSGSSVDISLDRTLRVPEDGTVYNPPPLFGPLPLLNLDLMRDRLPGAMVQKSGLLVPMYQREALSVGFCSSPYWRRKEQRSASYLHQRRGPTDTDFAIKILAASVNAMSGTAEGDGTGLAGEQDYIVAPYQKRVDGFFAKAGANIVRQFVAMPVFSGYTAENQLKGEDELGGMQLLIAPRFAGRGEFRCRSASGPTVDSSQQRFSPLSLGLRSGNILFVSGSELEDRFRDAFCADSGDALCTGPDFFIPDRWRVRRSRIGDGENQEVFPYPKTERATMVHELLATACPDGHRPSEPLLLQPVFRMQITIKSRRIMDFCIAKEDTNRRYVPEFQYGNPNVVTWHVSPFMSMEHFSCLMRTKFKGDLFVLFRGQQRIETDRGTYAALHSLFEDGAVIWLQAYRFFPPVPGAGLLRSKPEGELVSPWEMGLAPGGQLYQDICADSEPEWWNWRRARLVHIQMLNAVAFHSFTGIDAPAPPLSFRDYVSARLSFYHLIPQPSALVGGGILAQLKSVGEKDAEVGVAHEDALLSGLAPIACLVCLQSLADTILRPCNHIFCKSCIADSMTFHADVFCDACGERSSHRIPFSAPMEVPNSKAHIKDQLEEAVEEVALGMVEFVDEAESPISLKAAAVASRIRESLAEVDELGATDEARTEAPVALVEDTKEACLTPLQIAAEEGKLEIVARLLRVEQATRKDARRSAEEAALALALAAAAGHLEVVEALSPSVAIEEAEWVIGESPLEMAAEHGHADVVAYLLLNGYGPKPDAGKRENSAPRSAIHIAAANGHAGVVELLVAGGFDPNLEAFDGSEYSTPAREAAARGSEEVLAVLFRHGVEVNDDIGGSSLLREAVVNGHVSTASYLIGAGAATLWNSVQTPLLLAAQIGCADMVRLLAGTATAQDLLRSAAAAARLNHVEIVRSLLSFDTINAVDDDENRIPSQHSVGRTRALEEALKHGALETARYLLESGVDANSRVTTDASETLLHVAAGSGLPNSAAVVRLLLDHGAGVDARQTSIARTIAQEPRKAGSIAVDILERVMAHRDRQRSSATALHVAVGVGDAATFAVLLAAGADARATTSDGCTCLHLAALGEGRRLWHKTTLDDGSDDIVRQLLGLGLDPNQRCGGDNHRHPHATPLEMAIEEGRLEVTILLLDSGATLPSPRMLELATRSPRTWPSRRLRIAAMLLERVDLAEMTELLDAAAIHPAADDDQEIVDKASGRPSAVIENDSSPGVSSLEDLRRRLRKLFCDVSEYLTWGYDDYGKQEYSNLETVDALMEMLRCLVKVCPAAVDEALLATVVEPAARKGIYASVDYFLQGLPPNIGRRVAAELSNALGKNLRLAKMAAYLGHRYGGRQDTGSESSRLPGRCEIELPARAMGTRRRYN